MKSSLFPSRVSSILALVQAEWRVRRVSRLAKYETNIQPKVNFKPRMDLSHAYLHLENLSRLWLQVSDLG